MADKRKLQTEIDRCLKQVAERVEIFEETWEKVQSASNSNQKEKYEGDLKKEIKKLQRLRDQIKTWLAGSDVKTQRTILMEKRRLIEVQMERFKVIERETKTKAFSKEGLAAATKVDPREKERNEVREWLNECVSDLNMQMEQYEAELEQMSSGKKKKKKGTNSEKEDLLNERLVRHQYHIDKLEMLMRLLDNGSIEDLDKTIKESLEEEIKFYISDNADDDFMENEYMYDDFDEMMTEATTEMGAVDATKLRHEAEAAAAAEKEKEAAAKKAAKEEALREKKREAALKSEQEKVAKALKAAALVQEKKKKELAAKKAAESAAANGGDAAPPKSPAQKPAPINFAAMASKSPASPPQVKQQPSQPPPQQHHHHHPSVGDGGIGGISGGPGLPQPAPVTAPGGSWNEPLQLPQSSPGKQVGDVSQLNQQLLEPSMQGAGQVPAALQGMSGDATRNLNLQLLLVSSMNLPEPPEQHTGFKPQNPYAVPACYPAMPPQHFSQPAFFGSLETDTLFFIFYHQQGTYHQYLAARELKKQAWRFHKKYLTWFQRFEEPKIITDEYEQGTYVYFDFEAGWCQRKKADFTFEYRFLEDQDLP